MQSTEAAATDSGADSPAYERNGLIESALLLVASFLIPLSSLRLGGINLTWFDVVIAVLFVQQLVRYGRVPKIGGIYWIAAATMVAVGAVSGLRAPQPFMVLEQVIQYGFIFFCAVPTVFCVARKPGSALIIVGGIAAAAGFVVLDGVQMFMSGGFAANRRFVGFYGDAQLLAFSISSFIAYVFIAPAVFWPKNRFFAIGQVVAFAALTGMCAWLIGLSASRTGLLAGFAAPVVAVVLAQRQANRAGAVKRRLRTFGLLVAFVGVIVLMVRLAAPSSLAVVANRLSQSTDASTSLVAGRTNMYAEALENMDIRVLGVGVGLSNYPYVGIGEKRPHNIVLMYLWEGGIVFLSAFLFIVGLALKRIVVDRHLWRGLEPRHRYAAAAAAGGFIAFLIIGMFNTQSIARMYWFNFAYLVGALEAGRQRL